MASNSASREIGRAWTIAYSLVCLLIFGLFAAASQSDRGVVAGFSAAVVVLTARIRWDLRKRFWFWVILVAMGAAHATIVVAWTARITIKPTVLVAPIAVLDFIVMLALVFGAERAITGSSTYEWR